MPRNKSALVAVIGRPNTGKSTLVNRLLNRKLSITSRVPQTTRRRVMGLGNFPDNLQLAFFDTPGIHRGQTRAINIAMNKQAGQSTAFADITLWLIEAGKVKDEDRLIPKVLNKRLPTILVLNKTDKIKPASKLLPLLEKTHDEFAHLGIKEIVPTSAKTGKNCDRLLELLRCYSPEQEALFKADVVSDQPESFFLAELIREKIIRLCGDEVPHRLAVHIEHFRETESCIYINALVQVEQPGQKAIVIGSKGSKLKLAGSKARLEMEKVLGQKVMLSLWVKVKPRWSNNYLILQQLGYTGFDE